MWWLKCFRHFNELLCQRCAKCEILIWQRFWIISHSSRYVGLSSLAIGHPHFDQTNNFTYISFNIWCSLVPFSPNVFSFKISNTLGGGLIVIIVEFAYCVRRSRIYCLTLDQITNQIFFACHFTLKFFVLLLFFFSSKFIFEGI